MVDNSDRVVVVSTDGHCGADLYGYLPYLERRYHDEFETWVATYVDGWADLDSDAKMDRRLGLSSAADVLNWDSDQRLALIDLQGIAAEVLFPNTAPPFSPSGAISAPGPRSESEYELRWAGVKAHNRWLADFCAAAPGRRAGMAQVYLDRPEDAMDEIRWAKEAGLRGVLLPNDHTLKMANLYYPAYEPIWALCAELEIPIHRHAIAPTESEREIGPVALWITSLEVTFYGMRALGHLLCGAVFERHPKLKFVLTELNDSQNVAAYLARLDAMYDTTKSGRTSGNFSIAPAVDLLRRRPSEYFETNCFLGGPLDLKETTGPDGPPNLMFGADIPHAEGTVPFSQEAMRIQLRGLDTESIVAIAGATATDLYHFDSAQLRTIADRVGPTLGELMTPLADSDWPSYPEETKSRTFLHEKDPRIAVG
jgi:predicted TIM-barrel fold metal-dependent hydrolase